MGATGTKLESRAVVGAQALATVRQLLVELGGSRGLEELAARGPAAHLERELGLGSLERVELMLRLGDACGVRLPDRVVAEADTVQDLIDAILRECTNGSPPGARTGDPQRRNTDGNHSPARTRRTLALAHPAVRRKRSAAHHYFWRALRAGLHRRGRTPAPGTRAGADGFDHAADLR